MKRKIAGSILILLLTISMIGVGAAHTENNNEGDHHMDDTMGPTSNAGWMHNAGQMMGYNMWGWGWLGLLIGLTFWILAILGIVYIFREITSDKSDSEKD